MSHIVISNFEKNKIGKGNGSAGVYVILKGLVGLIEKVTFD